MTNDELMQEFRKDVELKREEQKKIADIIILISQIEDTEKRIKALDFIKNWLEIEIRTQSEREAQND